MSRGVGTGIASEPTAPAVEVVERLLAAAAARGASDLHVDPEQDGVAVRLRVDGVLEPLDRLDKALAPRLAGRLKALADLLVYRTDLPQEGRVPSERSGIGVELRVATYPALHGERCVVRLDASDQPPVLHDLGLPDDVLRHLRDAIAAPEGVVLVTGPAGSGKTTTLYACLRQLAASEAARSIVTVEDPVERRLPGVTQTEVRPAAGLDFGRALRSLLRQDPEVLLVGEIRDGETARTALEAGLTGHLVLSTVHAGHAHMVFARLLELGVEPFVLTSAVRGVLAQRLLRRRCPSCTTGCTRCRGTALHGRVVLAEWLGMSPPLRAAILGRGDGTALRAAAEEAGDYESLTTRAARLVASGTTTQEEVDRVLGSPRSP